MQKAKHNTIIELLDCFEDDKYITFVMDQLSIDLRDMLEDSNVPLPEEIVKVMFKEMLTAVEYIHSIGFIHRDIKLENFLIGSDINDIKLIDFGLSV